MQAQSFVFYIFVEKAPVKKAVPKQQPSQVAPPAMAMAQSKSVIVLYLLKQVAVSL